MYCSTCGARVPEGRRDCETCGAIQGPRAWPTQHVNAGVGALRGGREQMSPSLGRCPRCGYQGQGLSFFSRGRNTAALVAATVLTAGFMGGGGLVFYLARRQHQVCARCGANWGKHGEHALVPVSSSPVRADATNVVSAKAESAKRAGAVGLFVLAVILLAAGILEGELAPILVGVLLGGGGLFLFQAADRDRQTRRAQLLAGLQLPVLKLAAQRKGRLTVTEVAAEMGWPMRRAERVLQSLDDGLRVNSEVTDEGVIVYEFRELLLGQQSQTPPELGDGTP